ncbi:MAG: SH3 domain-containing protein [Treponema sp.]|nr:SH3 domain-containing protein [Treponema sp.]
MRKFSLISLLALCLGCFISCGNRVKGYGVLLWNLPEHQLQDGDLVPVYIRSNISQVYVIGTSQGKIEIPLWQITDPEMKFKAKKTARKFEEYKHTYASVALDGLPMRAEPVNTAKQVYRLKKAETIKILYKGKGQAVYAGKKPLEGDWLRVLTSDGTVGWCFSYNLRPFETDINGNQISGEIVEEENHIDAELTEMLKGTWYPDSYKNMIDSGRIDPARINLNYNLHLDEETNKLSFTMPDIKKEWDYTGATEDSTIVNAKSYKLNDIPIIVSIKKSSYIVVRYTGESGKPEDFNLVTIDADINQLVQDEMQRRESEYEQIYMFGPNFRSSSYGQLTLSEDHSFNWNNKNLLVPGVISSSAKNTGTVQIKYFLIRSLAQAYDGVLTFKFEGMNKEVNFFYKMEENGLRLEDATGAVLDGNVFRERGISPLIIFFKQAE